MAFCTGEVAPAGQMARGVPVPVTFHIIDFIGLFCEAAVPPLGIFCRWAKTKEPALPPAPWKNLVKGL
jgi:hypothetical protein